jgi:hypothetical protein
MKKLSALLSVAALALVLSPGPALALTFDLDYVFSGNSPSGAAPWMQVNIANISGGVQVDLVNMLKGATEFAGEVSINVNPALNPASFTYSALNSAASAGSVSAGMDAFQADGDGKFDILFSFPTANTPDRFTMGETASYSILYADLTEDDFAYLSATGGGEGVYYSAAHIQGIGPGAGLSGWIGADDFSTEPPPEPIPEPATLLLFGSGVPALLRRKKG